MAVNRVYAGKNVTLPYLKAKAQTASRTTNFALSGDPVVIGQIPGVALEDADTTTGKTVVQVDGAL